MAIDAFSPDVVFLVFLFIFFVFVILSFILEHHWKKYGYNQEVFRKIKIVYYLGSVVLLIAAALSAFFYKVS